MSLLWARKSDIKNPLAVLNEKEFAQITIPISGDAHVELLSGKFPSGMKLSDENITGIPIRDSKISNYLFTLRGYRDDIFEDRSFLIVISDASPTQWITPPGLIDFGDDKFLKDSSVVDFQFVAVSSNAFSDIMSYHVTSGKLPPGIVLYENGQLKGVCGFVTGTEEDYVEHFYPYKHPDLFTIGHDSHFYDFENINEYQESVVNLERITKYYEFQVTAYDGVSAPVTRDFVIKVVGDEHYQGMYQEAQANGFAGISISAFIQYPTWITPSNLGFYYANDNVSIFLDSLDSKHKTGYLYYKLEGDSQLPPGLFLDSYNGLIYGRTPKIYQNKRVYNFSLSANSWLANQEGTGVRTTKEFYMGIIDDNYSEIIWNSPGNLGTVTQYQVSMISVNAVSSNEESVIVYKFVSGSLPPGLSLRRDGHIVGIVNPFNGAGNDVYTFVINASDQKNHDGVDKEFTIFLDTQENLSYNDIVLHPYMNDNQRDKFNSLISDKTIFNQDNLFRYGDPNFGLRTNPEIVLYSGLQQQPLSEYVDVIKIIPRLRLRILGMQVARALLPGTRDIQYDVVYLELTDPFSSNTGISGNDLCSVRSKLSELGDTDLRQEKLWMRSIQTDTQVHELGFILAMPVAFCQPGKGEHVLRSIISSDHDIYCYDLDIDRIVIKSNIETSEYVMFPNRQPQRFV